MEHVGDHTSDSFKRERPSAIRILARKPSRDAIIVDADDKEQPLTPTSKQSTTITFNFNRTMTTDTLTSLTSCSTAHDSTIDPRHGLRGMNSLEIEPGKLTDSYEFIRPLGSGAFGKVELHRTLGNSGQKFAVKSISAERIKDISKFEWELGIGTILNHPNIVMLHSFIQESDVYYLIMDYCEGGDLLSFINRRASPQVSDSEVAASMFFQMLSGVAYLHHYRVAHRDIKPQNYMLSKNIMQEMNPVLKLIDFGAARTTLEEDGVMTTRIGTWQFAAPEVLQRKAYRKSCDMWSLGCTIYAVCARAYPFDGPGEHEFMKQLDDGNTSPNWEAKRWTMYSPRLKDITRQLIQVDPRARPTAKKLLEEETWLRPRDQAQQACCSVQ
eukprot:TRINITY_DN24232_c0_g1_i2.p1 TRINITY_DN24232_c0_g1~~TRINITY_DN24232_c0_g1_i2.p1  ORF type:complete len:405 (-),score=49.37 TRINITY_DN24232_c0_g1_i2:313-1464(-)